MRNVRTAVYMALVMGAVTVFASACATTGGSSGDRNRLSAEELQETEMSSLYHAVQRLRPQWLRGRDVQTMDGGSGVVVVMDGTVLGGVDVLRQYDIDYPMALEYMDGTTAASRIRAVRNVAGAIVIHTGRDSS